MATIPTTYLSFHCLTAIRAASNATFDTPLVLQLDGEHGGVQISLYLEPYDALKVEKLAIAINAIMAEAAPEPSTCPIERAAYDAAEDYFAARDGR
jgi:hypothetical protein